MYDAWSIKNAFMGPILFGKLPLLTNGYTTTFFLIAAFDLLKANYSNYTYIKSVSLAEYAIIMKKT